MKAILEDEQLFKLIQDHFKDIQIKKILEDKSSSFRKEEILNKLSCFNVNAKSYPTGANGSRIKITSNKEKCKDIIHIYLTYLGPFCSFTYLKYTGKGPMEPTEFEDDVIGINKIDITQIIEEMGLMIIDFETLFNPINNRKGLFGRKQSDLFGELYGP